MIVTYNGARWIESSIASLVAQDPPTDVIVVDNASTDGTAQLVADRFPDVQLIRLRANVGFGSGNNVGIAAALAAGAEYILLLNQDAYMLAGQLALLLDFMKRNTAFGVATPLHCSPDQTSVDPKTYRVYLTQFAAQWIEDMAFGRVQPHYSIYGVNAAVWLMRAPVFSKVGGFDPLFFMYGEDDDLLSRLAFHAVPFAFLPAVRAVHLRQSPPPAGKLGAWRAIQLRARRVQSTILLHAKQPGISTRQMVLQILVHGLWIPSGHFVVSRQVSEMLATIIATLGLLCRLPEVARHATLTATVGPHFLPIAASDALTEP